MTNPNPIRILLVEDNPGDADLTAKALKKGRLVNELHIVEDGVEALAFLNRIGKHQEAPRPDLILLDLNLPKKDGREVLEEIKNNPALKRIPVIVLTTSRADEDIARSYELHANSFITKPVKFPEFMELVQGIKEYWIQIVKLPPRG